MHVLHIRAMRAVRLHVALNLPSNLCLALGSRHIPKEMEKHAWTSSGGCLGFLRAELDTPVLIEPPAAKGNSAMDWWLQPFWRYRSKRRG
jgi:hypothetical protein